MVLSDQNTLDFFHVLLLADFLKGFLNDFKLDSLRGGLVLDFLGSRTVFAFFAVDVVLFEVKDCEFLLRSCPIRQLTFLSLLIFHLQLLNFINNLSVLKFLQFVLKFLHIILKLVQLFRILYFIFHTLHYSTKSLLLLL